MSRRIYAEFIAKFNYVAVCHSGWNARATTRARRGAGGEGLVRAFSLIVGKEVCMVGGKEAPEVNVW